jgi:hydrogenase large subunit
VASFYKDWAGVGGGLTNYLAYGDLPTNGYGDPTKFKFPRGIVLDRDLSTVHEVDARDAEAVQEFISHSWYEYAGGDGAGKHPWAGETKFNYTGPKPPYEQLDVAGKYSWLKTPRWKGKAMEVGPLARLLVAYASGSREVQEVVNFALKTLDVPVGALFSTLGRTAARGLETKLIAGWAKEFYAQLLSNIKNGDSRMFNDARWNPETWPSEAKGVGMTEAPRGALAHWIVIKDRKIDNYQLVVPSTWNASPRDAAGQRSSYEQALIGTPVHDPEKPLEILRTIHSFDPCIACAVHLYDEKGRYIHQITTF